MPFVPFKPLETQQAAIAVQCKVNSNHGLASKYCAKCKLSLCDKCAFDHAIHGAVDIAVAQLEIAKLASSQLNKLEEQITESNPITDKVHAILTTMYSV